MPVVVGTVDVLQGEGFIGMEQGGHAMPNNNIDMYRSTTVAADKDLEELNDSIRVHFI